MKPSNFDYCHPDSVDEALALLAEHGDDARIIAGGQSLMAMMNLRLAAAEVLIDITGLEELDFIREAGDAVEVGAAVTQVDLLNHPGLDTVQPLLAKAMPNIGHFQTRNRGTVCGSIAHQDPSSELPLCLAALEGEVVLRSAKGERQLTASEFQVGLMETARAPDELIVAVRFPVARTGAGYAFAEVARRPGDFAIVGLAGIAAHEVKTGETALNAFAWELGGEDDIHATAKHRRHMVRRLGRQVLEEAMSCAS